MVSVANTGFGPVPNSRKSRARICSFVVWFFILAVVIVLTISTGTELECYETKVDNVTQTDTSNRPSVARCGQRIKKNPFAGIFKFALTVISVVLGTLLDRFCLVFEECWHTKTRYDGKFMKMIKACFSGIQWGTIFVVFALACSCVAIVVSFKAQPFISFDQLVILILSGLGSAPLVLHLLNLDTQSEVHMSTLIEKMDKNVASGLAWAYYIGYLKIILPKLVDAICSKDWFDNLSSTAIFTLIPLDCQIHRNVNTADNRIKKIEDGEIECVVSRGGINRCYKSQVYRIITPSQEPDYYIILEYASLIATLYDMSLLERINIITEDERKNETRLFYRTLKSILDDPPGEPECKGKCVLVTYDPDSLNRESSLADLLIQHVKIWREGQRTRRQRTSRQSQQDAAAESLSLCDWS